MPAYGATLSLIQKTLASLGVALTTGTVFYVGNSVTGATDDTAHGTSPLSPFATLAFALTKTTAAKGDVVIVMPGHAESFTAAAALTASTSGVTIIGIGNGRNRPTFTWSTSTAAQVLITGANIRWSNCVFAMNGIDQIVAAIKITAADVEIDNCEFIIDNGTDKSVILAILTAATAARLKIHDCFFHGTAAASTAVTACIQHEVGEDYIFRDNIFVGKMTQAILNATTLLRGQIHGNLFTIGTGTKGIAMAAASTPMITNNRFNVASGTAPVVAAAGFVAGNAYSAAAGVTAGTALTW